MSHRCRTLGCAFKTRFKRSKPPSKLQSVRLATYREGWMTADHLHNTTGIWKGSNAKAVQKTWWLLPALNQSRIPCGSEIRQWRQAVASSTSGWTKRQALNNHQLVFGLPIRSLPDWMLKDMHLMTTSLQPMSPEGKASATTSHSTRA